MTQFVSTMYNVVVGTLQTYFTYIYVHRAFELFECYEIINCYGHISQWTYFYT